MLKKLLSCFFKTCLSLIFKFRLYYLNSTKYWTTKLKKISELLNPLKSFAAVFATNSLFSDLLIKTIVFLRDNY